jgi:hypothetical protein
MNTSGVDLARRIARLRRHLQDHGLGAALLVRPEHLRYFAGAHAGGLPAALVVTRDASVLIAAGGQSAGGDDQPVEVGDGQPRARATRRAYSSRGKSGTRG